MIDRLSLIHGWLPVLLEATAVTVLAIAVGVVGRTGRWWRVWFPAALGFGLAMTLVVRHYVAEAGWASDAPPLVLWIWVGLAGAGAVVAVSGCRRRAWRSGATAVLAVVLSVTSAAATLNAWVGYLPTVGAAWLELTATPLPHEADQATVLSMQRNRTVPATGVALTIVTPGDRSRFRHREELVYLPPAWFAADPPPALPTVMMIGGEFNTPTDWPRAGRAVETLDAYAAAHGGSAPVVVFVDSGGGFGIDTECVNGMRGNAADHLTRDVVPYMTSHFGVSTDASKWAVVGFSSGGTCAIDLTVMHPELFGGFVDISGDLSPNSGSWEQTIDRLFGGNVDAWRAFDPSTVMANHVPYQNVSGVFTVTGAVSNAFGRVVDAHPGPRSAATQLSQRAAAKKITCSILALPGQHDWTYAGNAFSETLPWLAARLGVPGARPQPMPATDFAPTS